jgi:hypothetical protein
MMDYEIETLFLYYVFELLENSLVGLERLKY